jgi:MFS family permease
MKSIRDVLRGNLLIFTLGDVLRQLSMFITFPYFSLYIRALGGSTVDIGLVNTFRPLAALFIFPIAGYLSDRYSRVKTIAVSGYISAALYVIFMLAPDWQFLAIGNFLMGLMVFIFPAMSALMADSLPSQQRGVGYSLWLLFPSAVGILAPYVGGYLITVLGIERAMRALYGWTIVTGVGISTMNLKLLREHRAETESSIPGRGIVRVVVDAYREMFEVLRWLPRSLKAFMLMLMLSFFVNNIAAPYWVVYGVGEIGLSELQWGTVLLVAAIVRVSLLVPAGMIVDRFGVKRLLSLALALSFVPSVLFPFSSSFIETILLFVVMTVANAFLSSGAPAFMAHSVSPDKRGRVMAALGQGMLFVNTRGGTGGPGMGAILTIPSVLGAFVGGFVYDYNPALPWMLLAGALGMNALISILFLASPDETPAQAG